MNVFYARFDLKLYGFAYNEAVRKNLHALRTDDLAADGIHIALQQDSASFIP